MCSFSQMCRVQRTKQGLETFEDKLVHDSLVLYTSYQSVTISCPQAQGF